ncbi:hypothetical protein [Levilactobacillus cerevisiae]|uniref:hypothetical protein n=1 Tax=Levilactobacillus cerevisiae TaxID=1704076 RepID=UPI000F783C2F|nr:hypothetical protein [Levilactobacillus cerevisiae]
MQLQNCQLTNDFEADFLRYTPELIRRAHFRFNKANTSGLPIYVEDFISAYNMAFYKMWLDFERRSQYGIDYTLNYYLKSEIPNLFRQYCHQEHGTTIYQRIETIPLELSSSIQTTSQPDSVVLGCQQQLSKFSENYPRDGRIILLLIQGFSSREIHVGMPKKPYTNAMSQQTHRAKERFSAFLSEN